MTAGAGHTAGHTEDRRGAPGARPTGIKGERERGHTAATEHTTDSRSGRKQRDQAEKRYDIFKGERREKTPLRLAKACKHCIYILPNIVVWWLFIALSFIYIEGVYNIYLYI